MDYSELLQDILKYLKLKCNNLSCLNGLTINDVIIQECSDYSQLDLDKLLKELIDYSNIYICNDLATMVLLLKSYITIKKINNTF